LLARTAVGDRVPLLRTAVGKAILASLPRAQAEQIITGTGLTAATAATITDREALYHELEATRARGYALDKGENEVGTYCIGAPIFNTSGRVIGACSISGTDPEIVGKRVPELSVLVMGTAHEISRHMGYVPATMSLVATPLESYSSMLNT